MQMYADLKELRREVKEFKRETLNRFETLEQCGRVRPKVTKSGIIAFFAAFSGILSWIIRLFR